ncbi:MAG: GNAT family acetyltransferase [Chloroflexota bacterium]
MCIRQFNFDSYLGRVLQLWQQAGPGIHLGRSDDPAEIRKKLARDPDLFLVAEEGGELVGAVMGGYDGRRGLVYHLAVQPSRRGRGLGRNLMLELERRLKAKGCLKAYLLVTKDNPQAVEFYHALGWDVMDMHPMGKELQ